MPSLGDTISVGACPYSMIGGHNNWRHKRQFFLGDTVSRDVVDDKPGKWSGGGDTDSPGTESPSTPDIDNVDQ